MRKYLIWAAVGLGVLFAFFAATTPPRPDAMAVAAMRATCVRKGTDYYIEIGSYPTLSDGRSADSVIAEKCIRSTRAFD